MSEVTVPNTALVECPLAGKKLRAVSRCVGCEHFQGILDRFPGSTKLRFSQRYMVACRYPFGRAIFELEEGVSDAST